MTTSPASEEQSLLVRLGLPPASDVALSAEALDEGLLWIGILDASTSECVWPAMGPVGVRLLRQRFQQEKRLTPTFRRLLAGP